MIPSPGREELYFRHQLSHQQIDELLGENRSAEYPASKAQYLSILNAFNVVTGLFESEAIEFIPQKGPMLSYRLYGDPIYRAYNDLDFLIRTENIPDAVELLMRNGFHSPFYRFPEDNCRRKLLLRHTNELFLRSPALDAGVELHWSMFNARITSTAEHDRLLAENKMTINFNGKNYKVLKEELELLFLVIHGGMHAWGKLKWLLDIVVFLEKCPFDQDTFLLLTRKLKAQRMVALCNSMLIRWFPGTRLLPSEGVAPLFLERFAKKQASMPDRKKSVKEHLAFFAYTWSAFPGARYKLDLVCRNLYATDLADVGWLPCFAPAYYVVSPFRKLLRGFR
ncbi:MAG: nucleotidyltransferase family protein [Bacteroidales bacterium]|nr:nucleotidyltransferase family protein [Bacteroidales bacterium]